MAGQKLLPVLLALALVACGKADDDRAGPVGEDGGIPSSGAYSLFDPTAGTVPFPSDFLFNGTTDGTLNIPNNPAPFVLAANELDGFSTTASLFTDFIGHVDVDSALAGVLIIEFVPPGSFSPLVPGVDYRLQSSTATDPGTGIPLNQLRTRMLIEPLKPLKPSTRYIVVVTNAVQSTDGVPAQAADMFRLVRSTTPVNDQNEPILTTLDATKRATLETIRQQLAPIFGGLAGAGIPRENVVIAWPFTTQSTTKSLQAVADAAQATTVIGANSGVTTQQAIGVPGADIYGGFMTVPYYLGSTESATAALTEFWKADHTQRDSAATSPALPAGVTCAQLAPSASTTMCYPLPVKQSDQTIPMLITVPNAASGQTMPLTGWPVVIFQHGITGNRSQMLPLAPALARAGFAVVAIDLPLHGIVPSGPSDPLNAFLIPGTTERTFNLDLVNSAGAAGPDGTVDSSGTHFINLSSLLTSRDNLRQAAADLVVLSKSVGNTLLLNSDQMTPAGVLFDGSKVHFVGHSLGGIVGTAFLGVNADVGAGVLAMPGGGIAKLLDGSVSFGPRIAAGLEASSGGAIVEGNDNYETFLRFAQTVIDAADPLNFAQKAADDHPLLMLLVKGDQVVPNCTVLDDDNCPALDNMQISGYLSGSHPLAYALGLEFIPGEEAADTLAVPIAPLPLRVDGSGHRAVMRFGTGTHASILDPGPSFAVTCEMQSTTGMFLASGGTALQIGHTACAN